MKIFKYPLEITNVQSFPIPRGYKILHVGVQNDKLYLWTLIDQKQESDFAIIHIIGTGQEFDLSSHDYIGSVQMNQFVWHIFKV